MNSTSSGTIRAYGDSELLVEASFTDLRHGGDGDLSKAYMLIEKVRMLNIFSLYSL